MRRFTLTLGILFSLSVSLSTTSLIPAQEPAAEKKPALLTILVPQEDTLLKIDGTPTKQTGLKRLFETPPLDPAKTYKYTVSAFWEPNNYTKITRERKVTFKGGEEVTLDLRKEDPNIKDEIVIRYVPTPQSVVEEMLRLAKIGPEDVVYDLGCGDGRIVVTAVSKFKAKRGVGVDIDPERIKESKANAQEANVEDKVEFRQEDILKMDDLSEATVVTLYLGNEMNMEMRPILRKTLKPGTRIVSHRFTMGDWKPDKTTVVTDDDGESYRLHLWTIKEEKEKE